MREGAVIKSGRGWSEVAGMQAKGDDTLLHWHVLLGQEHGFIYMY